MGGTGSDVEALHVGGNNTRGRYGAGIGHLDSEVVLSNLGEVSTRLLVEVYARELQVVLTDSHAVGSLHDKMEQLVAGVADERHSLVMADTEGIGIVLLVVVEEMTLHHLLIVKLQGVIGTAGIEDKVHIIVNILIILRHNLHACGQRNLSTHGNDIGIVLQLDRDNGGLAVDDGEVLNGNLVVSKQLRQAGGSNEQRHGYAAGLEPKQIFVCNHLLYSVSLLGCDSFKKRRSRSLLLSPYRDITS